MEDLATLTGVQTERLRHAPRPSPLSAGEQWHLFLSYYNALTQAGFTAFPDQFVLVPGDSLVRSLEEIIVERPKCALA